MRNSLHREIMREVTACGRMKPKEMIMIKHVIRFDKEEDRELKIFVDDELFYETDHDELGWTGMRQIELVIRELASILSIKVEG